MPLFIRFRLTGLHQSTSWTLHEAVDSIAIASLARLDRYPILTFPESTRDARIDVVLLNNPTRKRSCGRGARSRRRAIPSLRPRDRAAFAICRYHADV